jgi:hypothetical protein
MDADRPVKPYSEVESEWIKQEISERDFDDDDDRDFVDTLVYFEKMILEGPLGFASGMTWGNARNSHPEIYDRLQKELRPEKFAERKQRETQASQPEKEETETQEPDRQNAREEWQQISEKKNS